MTLTTPCKRLDTKMIRTTFKIKQVIAIMSVDDGRPDKGPGLREWFMQPGSEEVGRSKKVGYKFGRWVDAIYLQKSPSSQRWFTA